MEKTTNSGPQIISYAENRFPPGQSRTTHYIRAESETRRVTRVRVRSRACHGTCLFNVTRGTIVRTPLAGRLHLRRHRARRPNAFLRRGRRAAHRPPRSRHRRSSFMNGRPHSSATTTQLVEGRFQDPMLPSHAPPPTAKRKAGDDGNPFNLAAKKSKKEVCKRTAYRLIVILRRIGYV